MKTPSHSTVVAYVALFVAIGGSAYAVARSTLGDIRSPVNQRQGRCR